MDSNYRDYDTLESNARTLVGSGAEDAAADVLYLANGPYLALTPREQASRATENAHRAAEDAARNRRLDRQRIIVAALASLEHQANTYALFNRESWIAGYARLPRADKVSPEYVRELLAEIRAELSPLVR